jgi:RimJ/RimL family protein N-acetyltransferase
LGIDPAKMPNHEELWHDMARQLEAPKDQKLRYFLVWELEGLGVGFSSIDEITIGKQANMHLHVAVSAQRMRGHGAEFVRRSVPIYFKEFDLETLYCEPYAFNTAPNRALQKAGFEFVETVEKVPSSFSFPQPVTRWRMTREMLGN